MPGPHDGRGNVGCVLCALSLTTTLSPRGDGKGWRLCGGHDPKLVDALAVSHLGDLSLYSVYTRRHLVKSTGYCSAIIGL